MQKDVPLSPNEEICRISLGTKGKIFFLDSLASLVSAGIPIVRALQILYFQSENKKLRAVAKFLKAELERGLTITLAAGKMHGIFSSFDRSLIEMGESTGKIGGSFETIVEREEKNLELVRKVKQAMIYPIAIVFVAITMVSVIMVYVIPKIE